MASELLLPASLILHSTNTTIPSTTTSRASASSKLFPTVSKMATLPCTAMTASSTTSASVTMILRTPSQNMILMESMCLKPTAPSKCSSCHIFLKNSKLSTLSSPACLGEEWALGLEIISFWPSIQLINTKATTSDAESPTVSKLLQVSIYSALSPTWVKSKLPTFSRL